MTRQAIIEKTIQAINKLPEDKAKEISEFVDFVSKRHEDHKLTEAIQTMASESNTFNFLSSEETLYSLGDLKEVYNV